MRVTRRLAVLIAAGALGIGGLAVAAPAIAGGGLSGQPAGTPSAGPGWHGGGMGMDMGGRMGPNGPVGCGALAATAPQGTLTERQKATLATMAEKEKLAHDLYTAFADRYPGTVFDRVAAAETRHLAAVRTVLDRYGVADPTAGRAAGEFADKAVEGRYDTLLAQGRADLAAALAAGRTVEEAGIADLRSALGGLTAPDVRQVYTHLLMSSQHHLAALQG